MLLSVLLAAPMVARAEDDADEDAARPKKKVKADGEMQFDDLELTPKRKKQKKKADPAEVGDTAGKADKTDNTGRASKNDGEKPELEQKSDDPGPRTTFSRHRYGYVLGGAFLVGGLAFAYSAQGEGKRAETIGTAREAFQALENARASAATANVLYGVAAVTLAVTLIFELLPPRIAERASLTFHF